MRLKSRSMKGSQVAQSCLTLCDPMDCSLPGSSVLGIFQLDSPTLEWVAIFFYENFRLIHRTSVHVEAAPEKPSAYGRLAAPFCVWGQLLAKTFPSLLRWPH